MEVGCHEPAAAGFGELDDAARGEELTKGTQPRGVGRHCRHRRGEHRHRHLCDCRTEAALATGEVLAVWAHPQHTETSGFDASGAPMPQQSVDQVMVFTKVRLHNQSKDPLFLHQRDDQCHAGRRHPLQLRRQQGRLRPDVCGLSRTCRCRTTRQFHRSNTDDRPRPDDRGNLCFGLQADESSSGTRARI